MVTSDMVIAEDFILPSKKNRSLLGVATFCLCAAAVVAVMVSMRVTNLLVPNTFLPID